MSQPNYVRLICADGEMVEVEGRYIGGLDSIALERWVSKGVARVVGMMSMADYVRLPDDPDGVPLFREIQLPAMVEVEW